MTRCLFIILALVFGTIHASNAQNIDVALFTSAQKALSPKIATNAVDKVLQGGLWNSNRTAIAISTTGSKRSILFIFLKQKDNSYLAVDVGKVEGGNLGKLGTSGSSSYDRLETVPTSWRAREDGLFQVEMRTRAWRGAQRYTVSEPLVIRADGVVFWR